MTHTPPPKSGPLSGYKVIELAGIGPAPYAGQLLSDLGAEVISLARPNKGPLDIASKSIENRGKKSLTLDLRQAGAADVALKLIKNADILIESNRPGVAERLGLGPEACFKVNPKLVYGRMTGWGQTGPWAHMAGHDINYLSITGALEAMGKRGGPPYPPLNLVGDYGGGSTFLIIGIMSALLQAQRTGKGDVIDCAIIDGVSSMMGIIYSLSAMGLWSPERENNLLDGARPFYRCYKTQDNKFMAVGCIEPQFFTLMLSILNIDASQFGLQNDPACWPGQHRKLENIFASKTRDEWADIFAGTDACVTPVLNYLEAPTHPQNIARGGLQKHDGLVHPAKAPAFRNHDGAIDTAIPAPGSDTLKILEEAGFNQSEIEDLIRQKVAYSDD